MITLYTFGPAFGLPDPSPFCMKAMALLKMSGLEHRCVAGDVRKAPKGKMPYLDDNGTIVPDTSFIRWHLEQQHGCDFDSVLTQTEKATAWAFEKLCEDNLYWLVLQERWMVPENFEHGPRMFFDIVPGILRPLVIAKVKSEVKRNLWGQGLGRHSDEERRQLARAGLTALADFLAEKPYFMGEQRSGVDAAVLATVAQVLCRHFDTPSRELAEAHPNLIGYRDRLLGELFPEFSAG